MENSLVFVQPDDDLLTILNCFKNNSISHVPIIKGSRLLGIVSKTDVVNYLAEKAIHASDQTLESWLKKTPAKTLMTQPLITAQTSDSPERVLEKLLCHQVGSVVLVENGKACGILTEKDMIRFLAKAQEEKTSFGDRFMAHLIDWLNKNGVFPMAKALGDIGI